MGNILSDAPNRANPVVGVGQFIAWNGGCIFIGRHDSQIPVHAHQAIQLVVGRSAKARVHTAEQAPWIEYSAAIIASRQPHGLDVTASDYGVVLFVEPETRAGQASNSALETGRWASSFPGWFRNTSRVSAMSSSAKVAAGRK